MSFTLDDLLKTEIGSYENVERLMQSLTSMPSPYQAFFPLKRVKGRLNKVHKLKLNSYPRYLYLNPVDGVLISYENTNKFPHSPNYIIKLDEIRQVKILMEHKWYFKKGQYYLLDVDEPLGDGTPGTVRRPPDSPGCGRRRRRAGPGRA